MADEYFVDPQQNPGAVSQPIFQPDSPLISFDNEMTALRVARDSLRAQVGNFSEQAPDIEPLISTAKQIVLQLNHLLSVFLRDFYFPLKWSQVYREKERMELLDWVQKWHREFQQAVIFLLGFPLESQAQEMLNAMNSSLVYNSTVTNVQPPRAVKRGTKLDTSVRVLYNSEQHNSNGTGNGNVQASQFSIAILNEAEALKLFQNWQAGNLNPYSSPASVLLGLNETRNILSRGRRAARQHEEPDSTNAAFAGLTVDSSEKNSTDILERKFCLLYLKTVMIAGVTMETWCVSLPFVLMSNSNQTCAALATIFWDNYFKKAGIWMPFQVKEEANWAELSLALIDFFKAQTETEWSLTPENLKYIGKRIFKSYGFHGNSTVERKDFCRVQDKVMTNWRWLFSIVELIKKHLAPFWNSGAIIGFIDRVEAENLIRSKDKGTFLIRFSDSIAGGVSYTYAKAPNALDLRKGYKSGAKTEHPLSDYSEEGVTDLRYLSLDQRLMSSPMFTDVLYFEPTGSLDYQEVLKPKGEKFTRPPAQDAGKEKNGTGPGGKHSYEKPIVIHVDDPNSIPTPLKPGLGAEAEAVDVDGPRRDESLHNFVSSTSQSQSQSPNLTPNFPNEWQKQNLGQNLGQHLGQHLGQNLDQNLGQSQYPNQNQYQWQYQNYYESLNEVEWRPQDFLFNNVAMYDNDINMDMYMNNESCAESSQSPPYDYNSNNYSANFIH